MAVVDFLLTPWTLVLLPLLIYLVPFLQRPALLTIPGPFAAKFSNLWLLYQSRRARRSLAVDEQHKKYGKLVRVQPDHVSVADDQHINTIYGHGNGFLKAQFYDAFVSIQRGLFNTRDRNEHTRKRKIVSHTFSAKSIGQFEQYIHHNLENFVRQWDRISNGEDVSKVDDEKKGGKEGAGSGEAKSGKREGRLDENGYAGMDALHWFNFVAFDIIGDLAFGAPFGMVEKAADRAEVRLKPDSAPTTAAAVEVLNRRGEVSATIGCYPEMKPWARYLPDPFFSKGVKSVENLAGIAVARVRDRLEKGNTDGRVDLLERLRQGKDEKGNPLGTAELTAEALTQLIAGSDTTSNTSCALLFHCLKHPEVVKKLQKELDEAIPSGTEVPTYDMVKDLPYLEQVINEALRIHSTSSMGLPRLVPPGDGVDINGHHFPPYTVLSVPAYTIHHSKEIWGDDADEYDPDRWSKERLTERQKNAFIPFSYGPRSCVGRNVAEMELSLIVATVFRRYEFELRQERMATREGFLRKPVGLKVGMRRRSKD